jgi:N-hydroxyarylamine O-acetyltransferase
VTENSGALSAIDLDAYLARIGYEGAKQPTAAVLAEIQRRHVFSLPFENLDIHLGRPIRIDLPSIVEKIIHQKRGGYCFEQNALLRAALLGLGFQVTPLIARVRWQVPADQESALTHMLLMVECEGKRWLADGGFGSGSLTAPLWIDTETSQPTPHDPRRILRRGDVYVHQTTLTGEWSDLYHFTLSPTPDIDYEVGNWYTSTWPGSRFVVNLVAARADVGLRHTIFNREFTTRWTDGRVEKHIIDSPGELLELLAVNFGLSFPAGTRFGKPDSLWPS